MTQTLSRGLAILGRLYRPIGGQVALSQVDMGTPIQIVHDASREVELLSYQTGRTDGGFFWITERDQHAGVGALGSQWNPWEYLVGEWSVPQERSLWLMDAHVAYNVSGVLVSAALTIGAPLKGFNSYMPRGIVQFWDGPGYQATDPQTAAFSFFGSPQISNPYPIQILGEAESGILATRSEVTAAADVIFSALMWVGPPGITPPGMR